MSSDENHKLAEQKLIQAEEIKRFKKDEASKLYKEAVKIAQKTNDNLLIIKTTQFAANFYLDNKILSDAAQMIEINLETGHQFISQEFEKKFPNTPDVGHALDNETMVRYSQMSTEYVLLSNVYRSLDEKEKSLEALKTANQIFSVQSGGDMIIEVVYRAMLIDALLETDNLEQAESWLGIAQSTGSSVVPGGSVYLQVAEAKILSYKEQYSEALRLLDRTINYCNENKYLDLDEVVEEMKQLKKEIKAKKKAKK